MNILLLQLHIARPLKHWVYAMSMSNVLGILVVCAAALVSSNARAATLHNESVNGDLSNNRLSPTSLTLGLGDNDLFGSTQGGDLDYLTLTVPAGRQLTNLFLRAYSGSDGVAFIALQNGATFTENPNSANPANLRGYAHFGRGAGNVGANILPSLGTAPGSQGFTPPLAAGQYTFWIQQLGSQTNYQFDFVTVPEPSSLELGVAGLVALAVACMRRGRTTA